MQKATGASPPRLVALFARRPLVASRVTSFRIDAIRIRDELSWRPTHSSFRESGPAAVSALARDA